MSPHGRPAYYQQSIANTMKGSAAKRIKPDPEPDSDALAQLYADFDVTQFCRISQATLDSLRELLHACGHNGDWNALPDHAAVKQALLLYWNDGATAAAAIQAELANPAQASTLRLKLLARALIPLRPQHGALLLCEALQLSVRAQYANSCLPTRVQLTGHSLHSGSR